MKKLGLENKYKEEVSNAENEKDKAILRLQLRIDELTSSLVAKTAECEELKLKYMTLLEQKADGIGKTEISAILQENMAIKVQCKAYETENAELRKQVSYLSLFAPKRSEKQTVDKGENESGKSLRVSEQTLLFYRYFVVVRKIIHTFATEFISQLRKGNRRTQAIDALRPLPFIGGGEAFYCIF